MRDELLRPWRLGLVALLLGSTAVTLAAPARIEAQARAVVVLSTTLDTPVLTWTAELFTAEPHVAETTVAGAPTTLARPAGQGPWPAVVIVNGAAQLGRREPALQRLVRGLARAGYLVLLPDLPGLPRGELTGEAVATAVAVARQAAARADVRGGRVGLVGVSVGTSLALLAAQEPVLAGRVTVVTGSAPFADLANVVRVAATGYYRQGNLLIRFEPDGFLAVAVARSLAAALPPGPGRDALLAAVARLDDDAPDPLAPVRALPARNLSPEARALVALLRNREARRFDELYAALPAHVRNAVERLSPLARAHELTMPVELASPPVDKYFPLAESYALARAAPEGRVTVTSTLAHAVPSPSLRALRDLVRFNGWVVRSLDAAESA